MPSEHFIPQFYLRNFQIRDRPGWIYSYKRHLKPRALGIRSVACKDDYYTLKAKQVYVPRTMPDEFLSRSEDAAAPILTQLLSDSKLNLSNVAKEILSIFVAYVAIRTPMARQKALNIHKAIQMKKMQQFAQHKELFIDALMNELKLVQTEEEAEQHRQLHLNPEKNFVFDLSGELDDFSLERVFKSGEVLVDILLNHKKWILVEAPGKQRFITSDNPFVTLMSEPFDPNASYSAMDAEILVPISPQRALLFSNKIGGSSPYRPGRERMAKWVNQIIWFGYDQLFAHESFESVQQEFDKVPFGAITKVPLWALPDFPSLPNKTD